MRFTPDLEPGETLQYQEVFPAYEEARQPFSFALGLSDRAVHVVGQKSFAVVKPWFERRIPLREVREVAIEKVNAGPWWWLAAILIALAAAGAYAMASFGVEERGAMAVVAFLGASGLMLPFTTRGRRRLVIHLHEEKIALAPPPFLPKDRRQRVWDGMERMLDAFRQSGIPVRDGMA